MDRSINRLRLRWLLTAILYASAAVFTDFILQLYLPDYTIYWIGYSLVALTLHVGILWWGLPRNHDPQEQILLSTFGFGNAITLIRGLFVGLMAGFLFMPQPQNVLLAWTPALLYTAAILLDYFDGYIARITNHATSLGEMLDMEFDGLGILVAIALAIQYGQIPPWYLFLGFGRQLFIFGLWIRQWMGLPNYAMTASNNRRLIAGFQMGFLSIMLWPIFEPPLTTLACILFSVPLVGSFLRDWLVVSGQIIPTSARYLRGHTFAKSVIEAWLPLMLRVTGFCALALLYYRINLSQSADWQMQLQGIESSAIMTILRVLLWIAPVAAIALLLGIMGRVSSLVLTVFVAFSTLISDLGMVESALLISTLWVLQFGGGHWALWPVEEQFLGQRAGMEE